MGVEGKDRAKVLEAGAAALSNQLGLAVQRLRKSYGLSLADLSAQSGVAKSIISQIERNETNPTLTTIWRLAHALDVSIESMLAGGGGGAVHRTSQTRNDADLRFGRRTVPAGGDRLAQDRRLAAMVRFSGRSRRRARIDRPRPRLDRMPVRARGRARGGCRRVEGDRAPRAKRCAIAATGPIASATSAPSRRMRRWSAFSRRRRWIDLRANANAPSSANRPAPIRAHLAVRA